MAEKERTVSQGSPNTSENAWPVTVTNLPPEQQVTVVNTTPIPVSGTLNVGNTPLPIMNVRNTHIGQPPTNLVTLLHVGGAVFRRIYPDGISEQPFEIPANKVLIITDIDTSYSGAAPYMNVNVEIYIGQSGFPIFFNTSVSNMNGVGGGHIHLTSGFAISKSFHLIISGSANAAVMLHGYLIDLS